MDEMPGVGATGASGSCVPKFAPLDADKGDWSSQRPLGSELRRTCLLPVPSPCSSLHSSAPRTFDFTSLSSSLITSPVVRIQVDLLVSEET